MFGHVLQASVQRHLECFISMPGKDGGKAKPLKAPAKKSKDYDDDDKAFLAKKKEEEAALKKAKEAMLKGKKK
ncbi:hypothetical protein ACK3TF_000800 [Chlorella vulgaris]